MLKKRRLAIGIPSYNEEANIGHLLADLARQELENFELEEIIVYCDGCTDGTVRAVGYSGVKGAKAIVGESRQGVGHGLNTIMSTTNADVLVILNADIMIKDPQFLEKIAGPILKRHADLTSVSPIELRAKGFLEEVLDLSNRIKKDIFESYRDGNNVYTCHGQARAFSKRLYKELVVRSNIGEDAYSYFFCLKNGYRYSFVADTHVYYKLPSKIRDHFRQSTRFFDSKRELRNYFDADLLSSQYVLPVSLVFSEALKYLLRYPVQVVSYVALTLAIKVFSLFRPQTKDLWEASTSTKNLEVVND